MAYGRESIELTSTPVESVESVNAGSDPVSVPDAAFLFASEFQRAGSDLKLVADDGGEFLVTNYFATSAPPSLVAPNNASLDGKTVDILAGPAYPGQYAQAGTAAGAEPVGKIEKLEGSVTAQRADGTLQQLKAGDPVFESDVISTGKASLVGIRLVDGTVLALQESGKLVLSKYVYSANGSDNTGLLNILEGTFSLFAGDMAPSGDMKIQTPIATMGIRGTSILGVNVSTLAGRLSLTQDPNGDTGFIEVFNNLNGDLFTVLKAIFNKVTLTEAGLLVLSAKTPAELAFDLNLTQALHDFYEDLGPPQAGPEPKKQPLTGSPFFEAPTFQEIDFNNPVDPETPPETVEIPPELLIQFLASLLEIPRIQELIVEELQESGPTAGDLDLEGLDEATNVQEGSEVDSSLPFSFGPSGPGTVGFASLDGEPVLDANGDPVTTDGVALVYVWDATNNTLTAFAPGEDGADDVPIFSIEVDPATGAITVSIIGAVDHLGVNSEQLSIDLEFTVTAANGQTATGELTVAIDDAVPTAVSDVAVVEEDQPETFNVGLVLDISGSMAGARLQLMKDAVRELLETGHVVSVFIVAFASNANHLEAAGGEAWFTDIDAAIAAVDALNAGGGTDYIDALNIFTGSESSYVPPPPGGDQTLFYFLSDGAPNAPVDATLQGQLETFLQQNGIDQAFAVGIGNGVGTAALEPIAFPNGNDPDNPLVITDENELADALIGTLPGVQNVLNGEGADDFGADGPGGIQSIEVDGVTWTFDGQNIVSDGDQNQQQNLQVFDGPQFAKVGGQFGTAQFIDIGVRSLAQTEGGTLVVKTLLGGELTFHFTDGEGHSAGDWEYQPPLTDYYDYYEVISDYPGGEGGPSLPYENFRYTIFDNDGDTSTASLTIVVDPSKINEVVQGDAGDNVLAGAPDGDVSSGNVLVGNLGADTFVLNDNGIFDYIADYEFGENDQVDLSDLLDGNNLNLDGETPTIRVLDNGPGAVDALQVHDGESYTTVALLNGDAGVNIIVDDTSATLPPAVV